MKKIFVRGLALVVLFFATWFVLSQLDWISILKVHQLTDKTEPKLVILIWDSITRIEAK